jgi:hypothetical protein
MLLASACLLVECPVRVQVLSLFKHVVVLLSLRLNAVHEFLSLITHLNLTCLQYLFVKDLSVYLRV